MVGYINWGIASLAGYATQAYTLLPSSPLRMDATRHDQILGVMGWAAYFVPIHEVIVLVEALVGVILIWYAARVILAWFKMAGE